jgi:hypothetical protein
MLAAILLLDWEPACSTACCVIYHLKHTALQLCFISWANVDDKTNWHVHWSRTLYCVPCALAASLCLVLSKQWSYIVPTLADACMQVKAQRWGELTDDEDEYSEEESEEEEPEEPLTQEQLEQGIASGMITGLASGLNTGIDTDATLELRKSSGTATAGATPALYTVLEQQQAGPTDVSSLSAVGHTYRVPDGQKPTAGSAQKRCALCSPVECRVPDCLLMGLHLWLGFACMLDVLSMRCFDTCFWWYVPICSCLPEHKHNTKRTSWLCRPDFMNQGGEGGSVEVAVDPEQLEQLGDKGLEQLYEQASGVQRKEDHSDMIAANAAARKRKMQEKASAQAAKKTKDSFKF